MSRCMQESDIVPEPCVNLHDTLGHYEMESAAIVQWRAAHKYQDWKTLVELSEFRPGTAEYAGLFLLIGYGWLDFDADEEAFRMSDSLIEKIKKAAK